MDNIIANSDNNSKLKSIIVEYIFIDGYNNVRSKTRIIKSTYSNQDEDDNTNKIVKSFIIGTSY